MIVIEEDGCGSVVTMHNVIAQTIYYVTEMKLAFPYSHKNEKEQFDKNMFYYICTLSRLKYKYNLKY